LDFQLMSSGKMGSRLWEIYSWLFQLAQNENIELFVLVPN
jgi:hypothetical protein